MAIYRDDGINWIWYADVTLLDNGKVHMNRKQWRQHKYDDDNHPVCVGSYRIIERKVSFGEERMMTGITLWDNGAKSSVTHELDVEQPTFG